MHVSESTIFLFPGGGGGGKREREEKEEKRRKRWSRSALSFEND